MADLLQPIAPDNRDEYILCEIDGFILPTIEILLQGIRLASDDIRTIFHKIADYDDMNIDDFYHGYSFMTEREFLRSLSDIELTDKQLDGIIDDIYGRAYNTDLLHHTLMEYGLRQLLTMPYMKHLYLFSQREIQPHDNLYIQTLFHADFNKVSMFSGNIMEFIAAKPELTTIMMNQGSQILELLNDPIKYPLQNTMMILRLNNHNIVYNEDMSDIISISKFEEDFERLTKDRTVRVSNTPIDCITILDKDPNAIPAG